MNYSMTFISTMVAGMLNQNLPGTPTENRVLIVSPKEVNTTKAGIIIPGQVKEGVPRKGVIIKVGEITEDYRTYKDLCSIGMIVTYGMYAGKELEFDTTLLPEEMAKILENNEVTVLSMNEIIYSEPNNVD